jgi:hypothetical protein
MMKQSKRVGKINLKIPVVCIGKKENEIFLIYKENSDGISCKAIYLRQDFLIYMEMRQYLTINDEAVSHI